MGNKRNAVIDMTRIGAAMGIILCHVDLTGYGAVGTFLGQFLTARFSLMFFLAVIGFYLEKSHQTGQAAIGKRVASLVRLYGLWSLVYLGFSFVMLVLIQKMPVGQFLISRVRGFFLTGSYYHFWFYPAAIYSLLIIGGVKKLLGQRTIRFLMPLAVVLYLVGLLGTGYLPLGQQIPGLKLLYGLEDFEALMHLFLLGFPAVVFGMAAANGDRKVSGSAGGSTLCGRIGNALLLSWLAGGSSDADQHPDADGALPPVGPEQQMLREEDQSCAVPDYFRWYVQCSSADSGRLCSGRP